MHSNDRRSANRYCIRQPLRFRTAGGKLGDAWKQGRTLDMSASGIRIEIPEELAVGTRLEIKMDWTGLYHGTQNMHLYLNAAVIRTSGQETALRILRARFRDVRPTSVRPQRNERKLAVA